MKKIVAIFAVVLLLVFSSVTAFAESSPVADTYYSITLGKNAAGTSVSIGAGKIDISSNTVAAGEEVTLTATANEGFTFSKWVINGEYTLVDGYSLTDAKIVIIPLADGVNANAEFVDADGKVFSTADTDNNAGNTDIESPQTGESAAFVIITLVAACGVALFARKKIAE